MKTGNYMYGAFNIDFKTGFKAFAIISLPDETENQLKEYGLKLRIITAVPVLHPSPSITGVHQDLLLKISSFTDSKYNSYDKKL